MKVKVVIELTFGHYKSRQILDKVKRERLITKELDEWLVYQDIDKPLLDSYKLISIGEPI